jgi:AcrR family transcriptional regulator
MRPGDLTSSAVIMQTAMRLAADRGWTGVSIRDIATAAGVSSSLVVHHYRTKGNLQAAVDQRAVEVITELIDQFSGMATDDLSGGELTMSLTAAFEARFGGDSPLVGYLRRLLIDGGDAAERLFATVFSAVQGMLDELERRGMVIPSEDSATRAAFLLVNDLALMLLREQVTRVLGTDPLSRSGIARWSRTVFEVYRDGVFADPQQSRQETDDGRTGD